MPFRRVQKFHHGPVNRVVDYQEKTLNTGEIVDVPVDQSTVKLPDAEMFDITNLRKAGVSLEEVNSKVLSAKSVNADAVVRKYTKKAAKPEPTED